MINTALQVADSRLLENGWVEILLCCGDETCDGVIPVGECFYEMDVLVAVKSDRAKCVECGYEVEVPPRLWIQ